MIDAQAVHRAATDEFKQQAVRIFKDLRQFHANGCEIVDIEKPAVVDFLRGDAPKSEAIRLIVQERVQRVETACVPGGSIDFLQRGVDRFAHLGRFLATPFQSSLDDFLFACAFGDSLGIALRPARQIFERRQNALQLGIKIFGLKRRQISQRDIENVTIRAGRDGEAVFVVAKIKRAVLIMDLQLSALEDASVLIT